MNALAAAIGKGVVAGLVGTAAMTVSSTVEAKLRRRPFSTAPAKAAQKVLGIESFASPQAEARFSNVVHWSYGTGWGVARGILGMVLPPKAAGLAHFGAVWGGAVVMLPTLGVAPPVWKWRRDEVAIDVLHHIVYVTATAAAYELLG
jgi:uncharacterized membrane protein YagU involved in acid resistance